MYGGEQPFRRARLGLSLSSTLEPEPSLAPCADRLPDPGRAYSVLRMQYQLEEVVGHGLGGCCQAEKVNLDPFDEADWEESHHLHVPHKLRKISDLT